MQRGRALALKIEEARFKFNCLLTNINYEYNSKLFANILK
jgi:hypothetical protein